MMLRVHVNEWHSYLMCFGPSIHSFLFETFVEDFSSMIGAAHLFLLFFAYDI